MFDICRLSAYYVILFKYHSVLYCVEKLKKSSTFKVHYCVLDQRYAHMQWLVEIFTLKVYLTKT